MMQFFVVDKKPKGGAREQYRTDFHFDESVQKRPAPTCPSCSRFIGLLQAVPPIRVHLETWGDAFGDLAFWMETFLVSARFREQYAISGLKGLSKFERVEVLSHRRFGQAKGVPPEYFLVQPKRGGARIDTIASGMEWTNGGSLICSYCLTGSGAIERWRRVVVDEASWEGDDLFYAYGLPGSLLASERFRLWSADQRLRNLWLVPSLDSSHDFYPWNKRAGPTSGSSEPA